MTIRDIKYWLKEHIHRPLVARWQQFAGVYYARNPRLRAETLFLRNYGRRIDWDNPTTFAEKIRWIQFNSDVSLWPTLADKYLAREYVASKGCKEILIPLVGWWTKAEEIDFDSLPPSYVIKPNNGCGDLFVVGNKGAVSTKKIRRCLSKSMHSVYGGYSSEPHYARIRPCIIAEELVKPSTFNQTVTDYKFFCVYGRPLLCLVCTNRNASTPELKNVTVYDMEWQRRDEWLRPSLRGAAVDIPRPQSFEKMKEVCFRLAADIPFVRLDLYDDAGAVRFGEFTLTPAALKRRVSLSDEALQFVADRIELPRPCERAPQLSVNISTIGNDGIKRVAEMCLPEVEGVEYVVSWQQGDISLLPEVLNRNDIEVIATDSAGLSNNRNNAIAHSRGEIILIADDDLDYTAEQLQAIVETFSAHPEIDIASFRYDKPLVKRYPQKSLDFSELPKAYFPVSFEIAFRRRITFGADGMLFNPLLGLGAPYLRAGEEDFFLMQAMRRGYSARYFPIVITTHKGVPTGARKVTDNGVLRAKGAMIALRRPMLWAPAVVVNAVRVSRSGRARFLRSLCEMTKGVFYVMRHRRQFR